MTMVDSVVNHRINFNPLHNPNKKSIAMQIVEHVHRCTEQYSWHANLGELRGQRFLPLDEALASRAVFVILSGSDGRADGRTETLLEPAK